MIPFAASITCIMSVMSVGLAFLIFLPISKTLSSYPFEVFFTCAHLKMILGNAKIQLGISEH